MMHGCSTADSRKLLHFRCCMGRAGLRQGLEQSARRGVGARTSRLGPLAQVVRMAEAGGAAEAWILDAAAALRAGGQAASATGRAGLAIRLPPVGAVPGPAARAQTSDAAISVPNHGNHAKRSTYSLSVNARLGQMALLRH